MQIPDIVLSVDSPTDHFLAQFTQGRLTRGFNTIREEVQVTADADSLKRWLAKTFTIAEPKSGHCFGIGGSDLAFSLKTTNWGAKISFFGEPQKVKDTADQCANSFDGNHCSIRWVYDHQYLDSVDVPMALDRLPSIEMYPFLGTNSLEEYYDAFVKSQANILVLIGPPGTGKTSFIRGLLAHAKASATLTYNSKVIASESFFVEWLESDRHFMVLEDSDNLLLPRSEGNDLMSRFLNIGDGLMTFNKKMIFSTNLPNVSDIDDALTRPGRCFDILEFESLTREQASVIAEKYSLSIDDKQSYTLSEVFAQKRTSTFTKKRSNFGFC